MKNTPLGFLLALQSDHFIVPCKSSLYSVESSQRPTKRLPGELLSSPALGFSRIYWQGFTEKYQVAESAGLVSAC